MAARKTATKKVTAPAKPKITATTKIASRKVAEVAVLHPTPGYNTDWKISMASDAEVQDNVHPILDGERYVMLVAPCGDEQVYSATELEAVALAVLEVIKS